MILNATKTPELVDDMVEFIIRYDSYEIGVRFNKKTYDYLSSRSGFLEDALRNEVIKNIGVRIS